MITHIFRGYVMEKVKQGLEQKGNETKLERIQLQLPVLLRLPQG